jgi:hypothetical protein
VDIGKRAAQNFTDITEKTRRVNALAAEIATVSQTQSEGFSQLNTAVAQIGVTTQNNATSAEASAATSQELLGQASALNEAVENLQQLIEGRSTKRPAALDPVTTPAPAKPVLRRRDVPGRISNLRQTHWKPTAKSF